MLAKNVLVKIAVVATLTDTCSIHVGRLSSGVFRGATSDDIRTVICAVDDRFELIPNARMSLELSSNHRTYFIVVDVQVD